MRRIANVLIASFSVAALAACSTSPGGENGDTPEGDGEVTVGFSQATQQSPFYVELGEGIQGAVEEGGAEFIDVDANGDVGKQNNDVDDLITRDIDVLVLNPVDPQGVAPAMAAAESAGIPVVTVDRSAEGANAHVGRDNVEMGRVVGESLLDQVGDEDALIIEIQGDAGGTVAADRKEGFHAAFEGQDNVEILEGPYAEYIRSEAVSAMQDLLQSNPDVTGVYAHNDDMALGALQVLQENGRDDVLVAGVDGLMEAVEAIADGDQYVATSLNDPNDLGRVTAETALSLAQGEEVDEEIDAGTQLVNSENAPELVGDTLFAPNEGE